MKLKKMGRYLFLPLLVLALAFVAGCSNNDDDNTSNPTKSDWLFLFYDDADNNLNDNIFTDIWDRQAALSQLRRDSDNLPVEGKPSVQMVSLWDGCPFDPKDEKVKSYHNPSHPEAAIYELGALYNNEGDENFKKFKTEFLASNLGTETAKWGMPPRTKEVTSTSSYFSANREPDMGAVETLTEYLKWARGRYTADKIVLAINNHGAGTEYETSSGGQSAIGRSICTDDTNKSGKSLTSKDIRDAILASGYKIDIILMDCCLQGTAEIGYYLRGMASYMVTSPNISFSRNQFLLYRNMTKEMTVADMAKWMVQSYAMSRAETTVTGAPNSKTKADDTTAFPSFGTMTTCSMYDLDVQKQTALYTAFNTFAEKLLACDKTKQTKFYDDYIRWYRTRAQGASVIKNEGSYTMNYDGSYAYLTDIGYLLKQLEEKDFNKADNLLDKDLSWVTPDVQGTFDNVKTALKGVIVASWGGYRWYSDTLHDNGSFPSSEKKTNDTSFNYWKGIPVIVSPQLDSGTNGELQSRVMDVFKTKGKLLKEPELYGLTIVTQWSGMPEATYYTNYDKVTGYAPNWSKVLEIWNAKAIEDAKNSQSSRDTGSDSTPVSSN